MFAALGCRVYKSDTNLMGVLQLLLVNLINCSLLVLWPLLINHIASIPKHPSCENRVRTPKSQGEKDVKLKVAAKKRL